MQQLSFNPISLFGFAGRGMRRRGWLVLAATVAWLVADQTLYQAIVPGWEMGIFLSRRVLSAVMMAVTMAAIIDGGQARSAGLPTMLVNLAKAGLAVLVAEAVLWGPAVILGVVFGMTLQTPGPIMVAVLCLSVLGMTLFAPLIVPAALDGGRSPWAAFRANLKLVHGRRWLMLGLAVLMLVAMVATSGAATALGLLKLGAGMGAVVMFHLIFTLVAVMQGAAYLEFMRITAGREPEGVAQTFD